MHTNLDLDLSLADNRARQRIRPSSRVVLHDSHESSEVEVARGHSVKKRRPLALGQPIWKEVEWASSSLEERRMLDEPIEGFVEVQWPQVCKLESDGEECIELHLDFMGGKPKGRHDAMREEQA